ncbi:MAG: TetR/AcrR family transcriptional regulator [Spongiibacteraceae bacterium]
MKSPAPSSPPVSPVMPRKMPRQQRSIALVNALKDACLQILREEGADALTVARLSEVSGVAVVSMYEYFPTVEAVTAAAFRAVIAQLMREYRLRMDAVGAVSFPKCPIARWGLPWVQTINGAGVTHARSENHQWHHCRRQRPSRL